MNALASWAEDLARALLQGPLPRRWAHVQGVAARARSLAPALGADADLLHAATWLHDIGYAPGLVVTGFHALDGARYLRDVHQADAMLCRLVAHHPSARRLSYCLPRGNQGLWQQVQLSRGAGGARTRGCHPQRRMAGMGDRDLGPVHPHRIAVRTMLRRALAAATDIIAPVLADVAVTSIRRLLQRRHQLLLVASLLRRGVVCTGRELPRSRRAP